LDAYIKVRSCAAFTVTETELALEQLPGHSGYIRMALDFDIYDLV
jgi:hypothetical protein